MTDQPLTVWAMLALVQLATEPHDIGYPCGCHGCPGLARWRVPWPGREPMPQCTPHLERTLQVADVFGMRETILLGTRELEVGHINQPDEDPTAARFAAMELT